MRIDRIAQRRWALLALLATAACSGGGGVAESGPLTYATDVLVDTEWVQASMEDPTVRMVEVGGSRDAYDEGHIPGATFLSMGLLSNPDEPIRNMIATGEQVAAALSNLGIEPGQTIVLHDRQNNLQAARAFWVLKYYQHADVRLYNGGVPKWTADDGTTTTGAPRVTQSTYEAGPPDEAIRTTWQYVVDHTGDPQTLMCDVRSPDEYLGRDVRSERGGHVPGAVNLEWTIAVQADGTFRSAQELWSLYTAAGFTPDKEIITYCQSGVRGAHTWFVLSQLLGYPNVRNYDGSWLEYGNNPESPIES